MDAHAGVHDAPHGVGEGEQGGEEVFLVDGDAVFLDVVVFVGGRTLSTFRDFGQAGTDAGVEEADLDNGFPALVAKAWLDGGQRVDDVEDELGGFEDTFLRSFAGEVAGRVEDFGDLGDGEAAGEREVKECVGDEEDVFPKCSISSREFEGEARENSAPDMLNATTYVCDM